MSDKMKHRIKVTINGEEYFVKGSVPPEYIKKIANYVDQKMTNLAEGNPYLSTSKIAVLAALNITNELFTVTREYEEFLELLEEIKE
ncbi:MAG TPA: cell division protein ZapA [Thermoanaerobacterales bacterium]|nr:cell division protein ZapA [Thermoanaerobacterales bacterium]